MRKRLFAVLLAVFLAAAVVPMGALGASEAVAVFQVINGAWGDGSMFQSRSFEPGHILSEADIPNTMSPLKGYGGGRWQVDPVGAKAEDGPFRFVYDKLFSVIFEASGGQWDGETRFETQALAEEPCWDWPEDPIREGFLFWGWSDGSHLLQADDPIRGDTVLHAQWRENRWVTFDGSGGSWSEESALETEIPGGVLTEDCFPEPPERVGWEFDHWNTHPDGSGLPLEPGDELEMNTTAYAQWRRIFILHFDGNSEVSGFTQAYTAEEVGILSHRFEVPGLSRAGHTLLGWSTWPDGGGQIVPSDSSFLVDERNNPATLYALWERNVCQVRFQGTDLVLDCLWGDALTDLPTPSAEGSCRFAGWRTAPEGKGVPFTADTAVTENLTLYPHWIPQAEVCFIIENGVWAQNGENQYWVTLDVGTPLADQLPAPVPEAAFKESGKWNPWPGSAAEGAVFTYTCDGRQLLYVTFDTEDSPVAVLEGYSPALPEPTREGFRFTGWYTGKNGGKKFEEGTVITENLVLYARWIPVFTLTYDASGGEGAPPPVLLEEDGQTHTFTVSDEIPIRPGYSFQGWAEEAGAETAQFHGGDPCQAGRNVTLYAVWKKDIRPVTLTFLDRGEKTASLTLLAGEHPGEALPQALSRRGYRFLGWNTAEDGNGEFLTKDTEISGDMTLYACWQKILEAIVTFLDRGREVDRFTVEAGAPMGSSLPDAPSRKGYLFLGWQDEAGGYVDESTPVPDSMTVYAAWEKITRGVISFLDGEEELHQIALDLGAKIGDNLPPEPLHENCRFLGWNTREDGTGSKLYKSTVLREDMEVWAQWEEIEYVTLSFHDRFGGRQSITLEQGAKPGDRFPRDPSRSGYTFRGWYTEENGNGQKVTKSTKIQEDTQVYAFWKAKSGVNAKTGDRTPIAAWTAVMLLSAAALAVLLKQKRR